MSLAILIESIESDLPRSLPRNALFSAVFTGARARRAELAPFETVADLQRALAPSSTLLSTPERRSLVTALVEESQRGRSPLWSSLLVLAFAPMLHRLRNHAGARGDADLDSATLVAFLAAIRAVRPGAYTSLALRWATEKEVLTARIADGRLGSIASFDEGLHHNPVFHETEASRTFDDVVRALDAHGVTEILDVLIATRGRDESLRAYVARTCANPRERASRYEHLCRARLRFEQELREHIRRAA